MQLYHQRNTVAFIWGQPSNLRKIRTKNEMNINYLHLILHMQSLYHRGQRISWTFRTKESRMCAWNPAHFYNVFLKRFCIRNSAIWYGQLDHKQFHCFWIANEIHDTRALCNIGYLSEAHLKLKSREIPFVHNIHFSCPIVLKFCTECRVLCAKCQTDWVIEK